MSHPELQTTIQGYYEVYWWTQLSNYMTIDKTREVDKKLIESNKKLEENYDSN